MSTPKTPLSLHPDNLSKWFLRDPAGGEIIPDAILTDLQKAMRTAHEGAEKVAALAAVSDPTMTAEAAALRLRDAAMKAAEKSAGALDAARDKALAEVARVEAMTSAPPAPRDQSTLQLETEIRSKLATMTEEDRKRVINEAIKHGDDLTVGAFLRGPVFLTGAGPAEREMRRGQWREARFPAEADRLARLTKALEAVERGGRSLLTFTASIAESGPVVLAEAAKRKSDEAAAALAAE